MYDKEIAASISAVAREVKVIDELKKYAEKADGWVIAPDNYEGMRVSFDKDNGDGWFLLRLSLHDPLMPLNIESRLPGGVCRISLKILDFLDQFSGLDVSLIKEYK